MDSNQEIMYRLESLKPMLREKGVDRIGLFGSRVRGENRPGSDLDILLHFRQGFENFASLNEACDLLESSFPEVRLDVVTVNGLSPLIGPYILKEVVYA